MSTLCQLPYWSQTRRLLLSGGMPTDKVALVGTLPEEFVCNHRPDSTITSMFHWSSCATFLQNHVSSDDFCHAYNNTCKNNRMHLIDFSVPKQPDLP